MNVLTATAPHLSPVVMKTAPVNTAKPAASPATTGMKVPRPAPNSAPMNALTAAAPHPSLVVTKTAPVNTAKPAANPATTGTMAPKPAQSNAQPTTNIPALAPVTPAAPVKPVTENTKAAPAPTAMNGKTVFAKKTPKRNGKSVTVMLKTAISAIFFTVTEPVHLLSSPAKPPSPSSSTKAPTAIAPRL